MTFLKIRIVFVAKIELYTNWKLSSTCIYLNCSRPHERSCRIWPNGRYSNNPFGIIYFDFWVLLPTLLKQGILQISDWRRENCQSWHRFSCFILNDYVVVTGLKWKRRSLRYTIHPSHLDPTIVWCLSYLKIAHFSLLVQWIFLTIQYF
jgi:hypothetical protein